MKSRRPQRKTSQVARPVPQRSALVQIEKPIYGGSFLAREEGKAIFVPLALPGEQVRVRMVEEKSKRGYAVAEIEEVTAPSPERRDAPCPHFGPCGGCNYQHTDYANQLEFKQAILRETLERGGVTAPEEIAVIAGEPWAYRNRIRVAFDAQGRVGYRGRRSHALVPIQECPISAPLLVRAALAVAEVMRAFAPALQPTEVALFCDAEESRLLASVFVARSTKVRFDDFAQVLRERVPQLIGAELLVENDAPVPSRTMEEWGAQWGTTSIEYAAAGFGYRVDHGAFFQVNRWLVDALVQRVTAGASGALAWDLFAGVGLFARQLAVHFERVIAVEAAPSATDALAANLQGTGGEAVRASTLDFLQGNVTAQRPDLIVVDPPRTGLGAEVTALLAEVAAPRLVYVSCDPATLTRDLRALIASGYVLESVALADLFPQTFHLETVVHLRRA